MAFYDELLAWQDEFVSWRHDIHAHPELAFDENRTSDFIANQLASFGIDVSRGLGKTGVVGTLRLGGANKSIGLRADMDALPMDELNSFAHRSTYPGRMHGCGHDGHTVILLAAARYLAKTKKINGTVHFIFQPAEEANDVGSGAKAMIDDGLFEKFPMDRVFALHNAPGLRAGAVATRGGAMLSSMDLFDVNIKGQGCHGAMPHVGTDPVNLAAHLQLGWQTIIGRNVDPLESAVISPTSILTADSWNVIPDTVRIRGSVRALSSEVRDYIEERFLQLTNQIAIAYGASVEVDYKRCCPVTFNDRSQAEFVCNVARKIIHHDHVTNEMFPVMGSEDFSWMLEKVPGCYFFLGNSTSKEEVNVARQTVNHLEHLKVKDACMVHEPTYDFNDEIIPTGASIFVGLAESYLD